MKQLLLFFFSVFYLATFSNNLFVNVLPNHNKNNVYILVHLFLHNFEICGGDWAWIIESESIYFLTDMDSQCGQVMKHGFKSVEVKLNWFLVLFLISIGFANILRMYTYLFVFKLAYVFEFICCSKIKALQNVLIQNYCIFKE